MRFEKIHNKGQARLFRNQLGKLNDDEVWLYEFLQKNNKRLEQERITNSYILERLRLASL